MEIKDISVAVERLDDVRGGQYISASNVGLQVGANKAASYASGFGVGNNTASGVNQYAPQHMAQSNSINAVEDHQNVLAISDSVIGGFFPFV